MKSETFVWIAAGVIALLLLGGGALLFADEPAPTPEPEPARSDFAAPGDQEIIADFAAFVAADQSLDPAVAVVIGPVLAEANQDADARADVINRCLRLRYPDYAEATDKLLDEQTGAALKALEKLAASDDAYLAANAMYHAARAYAMDEDYEKALPLLTRVTGEHLDKTQYSGEAMFFKGVAQAETLDRKAAITTLSDFATNYPFSSERLVVGALHMIEELAYLEEKSLTDVQDRMDYSRRRLALAESGDRTQQEQQRIIAMLDALIEEAQEKENSGQGSGGGAGGAPGHGGQPQGNQQPSGPATESSAAPGQGRMGSLHRVNRGSEEERWGEARDRKRDEVLNAIKAKYPQRYRELVEQYYRSLQEDDG